jgi:hypothetical protein
MRRNPEFRCDKFNSMPEEKTMSDTWLASPYHGHSASGIELAVKLSRVGVKATQPSDQVRSHLRCV